MDATEFRLGVDIDVLTDDEEITTQHVRVKKIENLDKCKNLKKLAIIASGVEQIEGIQHNTQLAHLEIYQGLIREIRNVSHLTNLVVLDLSFNKIERIENLDQLVNLEKLYLASNRISEIEGLSNLRKLKVLELGSNKIRRIGADALVNQTELEELWLGKNRLEDMDDLTQFKFPKLSQLALQANKLTEWSTELFRNTAPNLRKVYLGNNGLPDPDEGVLMGLNAGLLEDLDISYNRLTRVPNFTCNPLNKLQELWLNHNLISRTESFSNIKTGCPGLLTVYLEGNPVQKECPLDYRNSLMDSLPDTVEKIDATMIPQRQINVISSDGVGPHVHKTILKH